MTPLDVLAWLAGGGFTVRVEDGRLWISPAAQLTEADRALVTEHRDALLAYLADPPASGKSPARRPRLYDPGPQRELFGEDDLAWR